MTKALWCVGVDWLAEGGATSTHPHDRDRARDLARGMRMVGEQPPFAEVSRYIGASWPHDPYVAAMVRDVWRSVTRAKTSLGRSSHWHHSPLYTVDRLIEVHSLQPVTEVRLARLCQEALAALLAAAEGGDVVTYRRHQRDLDASLMVIEHLRVLRLGSLAIDPDDGNPTPPRRPRWW